MTNCENKLTSRGVLLRLAAILYVCTLPINLAAAPAPLLDHGALGLAQLTVIENEKVVGGFKYDFIEELGRRIGSPTQHRFCPFLRCLRSMKNGSMNIMMFISVTPQRSEYLDYIQVWPIPLDIPFYVRQGEQSQLTTYEDLHSLRIGVVNGYFYFKRFDNDTAIVKSIVLKESQLPKMLMAGRIDAYIGFNLSTATLQQQYPHLVRANYSHKFSETALLAISKHSELAKHLPELKAASLEIIQDGTIDRLWAHHFNGEVMPYPPNLKPQNLHNAGNR